MSRRTVIAKKKPPPTMFRVTSVAAGLAITAMAMQIASAAPAAA
jgi:hypothetical protein